MKETKHIRLSLEPEHFKKIADTLMDEGVFSLTDGKSEIEFGTFRLMVPVFEEIKIN